MRKELPTNANPFHQNGQPTGSPICRGLLAFVAQGSNLRTHFRTTLRTTTQPALKTIPNQICSKLLHFLPIFFFGRKFIAGRGWEILKNFIKYIKNFSKIFKKFWELDRKIFSPYRCHPWFGLVGLGKPVSSVCYTFLHASTIMKHLDTFILASRRNNLTFSSWHRVCMGKPLVGVVGQSNNPTSATESKFRAKHNNLYRLSENRLSDERR